MPGIGTYRIMLLSLVAASAAYSQGTVNFVNLNTSVTPIIDARISYTAGGPMPGGAVDSAASVTDPISQITYGGASARVGLYGGPAGTKEKDLVLLGSIVGFGTGPNAGYIASGPDSTRTVPSVAAGQPAVIQLRGWDAGLAPGESTPAESYEAADLLSVRRGGVYLGKTRLVDVSALGGNGAPPAELFGLPQFDLPWFAVPEPSMLTLAALAGFAGLLVVGRKPTGIGR